jgi:dipeptidyl aminopeptidase/acylaminoacyl peptidase
MDISSRSSRPIDARFNGTWDGVPVWSNDGTRVATVRGFTKDHEGGVAAILTLGGGPVIESAREIEVEAACCSRIEWAPDDSAVLWTPTEASGRPGQQLLIDPLTGAIRPALWATTSDPAWQRQAP